MAFATGYLADPNRVQGGESFNEAGVDLAFTTFEDGLRIGRFAKLDSGSIDNMDASATPNIAGIVARNDANAVEDGGTIDNTLFSQISVRREGLMSVDVKSGESAPDLGGQIGAYNVADGDQGLALASGGIATTAEFVQVITTNVWLVRLGAYDPS